jgi:hypothetical protein
MTQSGSPGGSQPQPGRAQPPGTAGQPPAWAMQPSGTAGQPPAWAESASGAGRLRRFAWASVPVWSLGLLAFAPFLRLAVARRGRKDWAVFAGYLAVVVAEIVMLSLAGNGSGQNSGASAAAGGLVILLMGAGAVHSYAAFGKQQDRASASWAATSEQLNREALATARGRMERRREAREIAGKNRVLCRELRIGRPDLAREYDDGGLVDVNQVPGEILQSQLGLSADESAAVLAARTKLGSFTSADEVSTYAQLPPARLDAVRDWMIFS